MIFTTEDTEKRERRYKPRISTDFKKLGACFVAKIICANQ
jgi:hypothetical protein